MFRIFVFLFAALGFSMSASGQTFASTCRANVDCKGLFSDLLTAKFLAKYPADTWEIFVYADTLAFGDGKATSQAVVGVVPISRQKFAYFPNQTSSHIVTTPRLSSAYDKDDVERKTIRRAIEKLMASCNEVKDCNLD